MQKTKFNKFLEKLEKVKLQNKILAIVLCIVFIYITFFSIHYVGRYIEVNEINNGKYTEILTSEIKINIFCFFAFFIISYIITYIQNKIAKICIKKAGKKEKIKVGKLPNKSLCVLIAIVFSYFATAFISKDLMIYLNEVESAFKDPIFSKNISYYILQRPFIVKAFKLAESFLLFNIIYIIGYYIAAFGFYFKGLSDETRKKSAYMIHILGSILVFCVVNILETFLFKDTVLFTKLNLNNDSLFSSLMGSGYTDINIKLWYFRFLPYILLIGLITALSLIINKKYKKLVVLPVIYVGINIAVYLITGIVQNVYVKPNELTLEKKYIKYHLDYTKKAYDIETTTKDLNVETNFSNEDIIKYSNVIKNIDTMNYENTLQELNSKEDKYYSYASIDTLVKNNNLYYVAAKEASTKNLEKEDYINRYIKYTHGNEIKVFKRNIEEGKLQETKEVKINNKNIYYGINTKSDCIVNPSIKLEKENIDDTPIIEENYTGQYGISMRKLNRAVMAFKHFDYNFLLSDYIKDTSKFLINRNIIERVSVILPNMLIDSKPYLVIGEDNNPYYIIDAYTASSSYPYSKPIDISKKDLVETKKFNLDSKKINYIRNSVKVIVDPYSGKLNIFNTDEEDIISKTYSKMYKNLFDKKEGNSVYEAVEKHLKYPKTLMDIQIDVLKDYYVTHPENFYKNDSIINLPKYIDDKKAQVNLTSYYTFAKLIDREKEEYILMQPVVNANDKLTGYFSGYVEKGVNKLDFYAVTNANTVLSPMLMDKQILVENTDFSTSLEKIKENNKINKKVIVVPLDNKILNIQIYFVTPQEWTKDSRIYKIIISDGQKIAISKTIEESLMKIANAENSEYISDEIIKNDLYSNIEQVLKTYDYVKKSMKQGEFEVFGREMQNLEKEINKLKKNYENVTKNK